MLSALLLLLLFVSASCFLVAPPSTQTRLHTSSSLSATKTTLTEDTKWSFRFLLNGIPTEKGRKVDQLFVVEANFIEEDGYEPPQGSLQQVQGEETTLNITSSRWMLSEDPNDRKDGLWVWGLFEEPLYPFMLLQLETAKFPLPGQEEDAILPLKLFAQINHYRDEEKGVILSQAELKVREMETVKADPIGAATVDVYEEVSIGQLTIQAI